VLWIVDGSSPTFSMMSISPQAGQPGFREIVAEHPKCRPHSLSDWSFDPSFKSTVGLGKSSPDSPGSIAALNPICPVNFSLEASMIRCHRQSADSAAEAYNSPVHCCPSHFLRSRRSTCLGPAPTLGCELVTPVRTHLDFELDGSDLESDGPEEAW